MEYLNLYIILFLPGCQKLSRAFFFVKNNTLMTIFCHFFIIMLIIFLYPADNWFAVVAFLSDIPAISNRITLIFFKLAIFGAVHSFTEYIQIFYRVFLKKCFPFLAFKKSKF